MLKSGSNSVVIAILCRWRCSPYVSVRRGWVVAYKICRAGFYLRQMTDKNSHCADLLTKSAGSINRPHYDLSVSWRMSSKYSIFCLQKLRIRRLSSDFAVYSQACVLIDSSDSNWNIACAYPGQGSVRIVLHRINLKSS